MITAICPGTYDPVTNGHVDVITRAAGIFDRVVIGVVGNPHHKTPMFSTEERIDFLKEALGHLDTLIREHIAQGRYPGAQIALARHGQLALFRSYGKTSAELL